MIARFCRIVRRGPPAVDRKDVRSHARGEPPLATSPPPGPTGHATDPAKTGRCGEVHPQSPTGRPRRAPPARDTPRAVGVAGQPASPSNRTHRDTRAGPDRLDGRRSPGRRGIRSRRCPCMARSRSSHSARCRSSGVVTLKFACSPGMLATRKPAPQQARRHPSPRSRPWRPDRALGEAVASNAWGVWANRSRPVDRLPTRPADPLGGMAGPITGTTPPPSSSASTTDGKAGCGHGPGRSWITRRHVGIDPSAQSHRAVARGATGITIGSFQVQRSDQAATSSTRPRAPPARPRSGGGSTARREWTTMGALPPGRMPWDPGPRRSPEPAATMMAAAPPLRVPSSCRARTQRTARSRGWGGPHRPTGRSGRVGQPPEQQSSRGSCRVLSQ